MRLWYSLSVNVMQKVSRGHATGVGYVRERIGALRHTNVPSLRKHYP